MLFLTLLLTTAGSAFLDTSTKVLLVRRFSEESGLVESAPADNETSIKLFKKAGFVEIGIKKDWLKTVKGWKDEILFQKMLG